mgnify:CR=1 FL=1
MLVSTPSRNTAFNLFVYGPILSLNLKKLSISPKSPFRPRKWKGKILKDKSFINIKKIKPTKRPISAVTENNQVRNTKSNFIKTIQNCFLYLKYIIS